MKILVRKSLHYVIDAYRQLHDKLQKTEEVREREVIVRRLVNLLGVMQFLLKMPMVRETFK